jgi:hypothetical protein
MTNRGHRPTLVGLLATLFFLFSTLASGQEFRGRVQGNVTDPSKAAIVAAKVTLTNVGTGVETVRETDAAGFYRFDFVQPGAYTVTVESPGFNRYIRENIRVLTAGDVTVNVEMSLGAVTEAVTVTAEVATVQFNTSTMTTTVQSSVLRDIPVLARNPFTLALLNPAVVNQYWDVSHRNPFYMWSNSGLDIGGSTGGKNDQLLDGVPTGVAARGSYNSPMDAVQEVVVQQNAVDAEYGFSAGGVLNLSMKSGTNEVHGTAYYFGRNPYFNAVVNPITRTPSFIKNHVWGGTLGNPIKKNKLFNFFVYEQWRQTQPASAHTSTVPTDLERGGDFSQTRTPQGALRMIYDPLTTQFDPATSTVTRTPFAGNRIPAARIDPTGRIAVNDLWKPNGPGDDASGINNFKTAYSWWHKYWNISDRVDYNATDKLRMYFRFSRYQTDLDNPNWGGTRAVRSDNGGVMDADNAAADGIYMFSPTTTLNLRFGFTRAQDDYDSQWAKVDESVWGELWPNGWYKPVTAALPGVYYPSFGFSGNGSASAGIGSWWLVREYQTNIQANVTHTRGMHNLKFGLQWRNSWEKNGQPGPGGFSFNSIDTGSTFLGYNASQSGSQFASALLGVVNSGNARILPMWHLNLDQYALYLQDDIKLSRNVTLNLGLRWEYETAPSEVTRMFSRFLDLDMPIPELQGGITVPSQVTAIAQIPYRFTGGWIFTDDDHPGVYNPPKTNFLPRVGVAVRLTDRMSFRAGWARYATPIRTIYTEGWDVRKEGFSQTTTALGPLNGEPRAFISNPFPTTNPLLLPPGKSRGIYTQLGDSATWWKQDLKTPVADRFNVSLQRQLPASFALDTTFFMHFGHNVHDGSMWGGNYSLPINLMDPNLAYTHKGAVDARIPNPFYNLLPADKMPGALRNQQEIAVNQLLRPYPHYLTLTEAFRSDMQNRYYALQIQAQRPMLRGMNLILGYNYNRESKSEYFDAVAQYNDKLTLIDRRRPRHSLRMAGTYELPFGRGRQYLSGAGRLLDLLVGGWGTSHWFMIQGGNLLTFGAAQVTGDPRENVPEGRWFNPAVFSVLPAYTPRTNPWYYDGLRGPRFWSLDSTLVKYVPLTERVRLELRFEFYNMPNHFIESDPNLTVGSGIMGRSTGVFPGNYGREVQYTARFHW